MAALILPLKYTKYNGNAIYTKHYKQFLMIGRQYSLLFPLIMSVLLSIDRNCLSCKTKNWHFNATQSAIWYSFVQYEGICSDIDL